MAKETGRNDSIDQLKADIARSRDVLVRDVRGLRYQLDIPARIRRSFREQTPLWIGGAVVLGALLIMAASRKKKVYVDAGTGRPSKNKLVEAGFALGALRIAASLLKPMVANFIIKKVGDYASGDRPIRK
jgi:hypothetical protein